MCFIPREQLQETNARINRIMFDPSPGQAAGTQMENNRVLSFDYYNRRGKEPLSRIEEAKKRILTVTVRYSGSQF